RFSRPHKAIEFAQEFIRAQLVGIIDFEIRETRIAMPAQFRFCSDVAPHHRDSPRIRTGRAVGFANACGQRLSLLYRFAWARAICRRWRAFYRGSVGSE